MTGEMQIAKKSIQCIQHSMKEVLEGVQVVRSRKAVGANRAEAVVALLVHMESTGVNLSGENITVK